tara:strand:- start:994 stop:1200 length:207 start_codon:yes stop_codon:yes gene_type:complete
MKQKILLLKMAWQLMKGNHAGWVFFTMDNTQQVEFLKNEKEVDIKISYVGLDKRIALEVARRIETNGK